MFSARAQPRWRWEGAGRRACSPPGEMWRQAVCWEVAYPGDRSLRSLALDPMDLLVFGAGDGGQPAVVRWPSAGLESWRMSPPRRIATMGGEPFPQSHLPCGPTPPSPEQCLTHGRRPEPGPAGLMAERAVSTGCKYNQVNSHFHCIREGCQFSFLLKHQMTSHARKHMRRMLGKNFDRVPPSQVRARPTQGPTPASRWWATPPRSIACHPPVGSPATSPASSGPLPPFRAPRA